MPDFIKIKNLCKSLSREEEDSHELKKICEKQIQ